MRKIHQKMMLDLLRTLGGATDDVKKLRGKSALTNLLADCQDAARGIGEFVESVVGAGEDAPVCQTITYLEEYCDLLYQASVELASSDNNVNKNNDNSGGGNIVKKLNRQIIKIENSIKEDLKVDKIEIAFFPYKASMWDSLESIYLAAKDDPACDAYVVPIPYYEKNPDGSLGKMCFEGGEYPKNIPVADYKTYNIEERRPDVVFIHNPYDGNNFVTGVPPDYYSERLRQFTDMLCYVPYFVVGGDAVQEHFTIAAGCVHAHRVFAQSVKIRESYIYYFKKKYGGKFGKAEDKFVALGSPKFDKAINTKREDCDMPDAWRKIIGDKKVVFYNSSIGAILAGNTQYLKKLRHVLNTFRGRDDMTLWWRPHPLNKATCQSMRPWLLSEYEQLIAEYKREGFGIFDDTADMNRAIACTDIYYGDASSLTAIYGAAGKPIVIQNVDNIDDDVRPYAIDFSIDDDGAIWAFDLFDDALFKIDFENNAARYVTQSGRLPVVYEKKYSRQGRYNYIRAVGDNVFCLPTYLDDVLIYDRKSGETTALALDKKYWYPLIINGQPLHDGFGISRFTAQYQGKMYCFGACAKAVIVIDCADHSIKYDTKLFDKIGLTATAVSTWAKYEIVKHPIYMSECSDDGKITMLMLGSEHLIRYTLQTQEVEIIASNKIISQCNIAAFDGKDYWLITVNCGKLIKWNADANKITEYPISFGGITFADQYSSFSAIVDIGGSLLIFPGMANVFLKFDKDSCKFSGYDGLPMPESAAQVHKYDAPKRVGEKIYAFARYNYMVYELDTVTGVVTPHKLNMDSESRKRFCEDFAKSAYNEEVADGIYAGLNDRNIGNVADFFAGVIREADKHPAGMRAYWRNIIMNADGTSGAKIYDYCKKTAMDL